VKARLEIEMPYNCFECQFRRPTISGFKEICVACEHIIDGSLNSTSEKPDWCPLEPVLTVGDYVKGEG